MRRTPGLRQRGAKKIWHIEKVIFGVPVSQSTGTSDLSEAERRLIHVSEQIREAKVYGVRPKRTFDEAAARYIEHLEAHGTARAIRDAVSRLDRLMPYVGSAYIDEMHMGAFTRFVADRKRQGVAAGTINHALKVARHIFNLAAREWIDDFGLTWLVTAPKIRLLPDRDKRQPSPFTWDEQDRMFSELPSHLAEMALFGVNTGCRDHEICTLRWDWEYQVPELGASVFAIPRTKNKLPKLVVLNRIATSVIESVRGRSDTHVFTYRGRPLSRMLNSAWVRARNAVGMPHKRVHDLRHTYGHRLRAAGVSYEDRQDLLGHKSGRMTTHYSAPEIGRLLAAAETVCERHEGRPTGLALIPRAMVNQ